MQASLGCWFLDKLFELEEGNTEPTFQMNLSCEVWLNSHHVQTFLR